MALRRSVLSILVAAAAFLAAPAFAVECRDDVALLRYEGRQARFSVEVADDAATRAQGLMFREQLPMSAGMLFIYERPQAASFWMKNTPLPLDMLFIDPTGLVVHIHENARPFDETPIPGGDGILMVLEINGGLSRRIGLKPGAELAHPRLDRQIARFLCD